MVAGAAVWCLPYHPHRLCCLPQICTLLDDPYTVPTQWPKDGGFHMWDSSCRRCVQLPFASIGVPCDLVPEPVPTDLCWNAGLEPAG